MIRELNRDFVITLYHSLPEPDRGFQGNCECEAFQQTQPQPQLKERGLPKIDSSRDKPVASAITVNQQGRYADRCGSPSALRFAMLDLLRYVFHFLQRI